MKKFALLVAVTLSAAQAGANPEAAARQAQAQTGGRVLSVTAVGERRYRVKVLLGNGVVKVMVINTGG